VTVPSGFGQYYINGIVVADGDVFTTTSGGDVHAITG